MIPERTLSLAQSVFLRGRQTFEICEDELKVGFRNFRVRREFSVPLWQIDPSSERIKQAHVSTLLGAIIFGVCAAGTIAGMIASRDLAVAAALGFPLFFFLVLFGNCFWKFRVHSIDAVIFHLRNGGQLHLWSDSPALQPFEDFCASLKQCAKDSWERRPVANGNSLAGEIAELKKLKDTSVLSEAEFERAKAKLIEASNERRIGFQ